MNNSWHAFPKVWSIGHGAIGEIFYDIIVQEKVDGSQFSFGVIDGVLRIRSKGKEINLDAPEKMFSKGIATVREVERFLTPGYTYRCEYLEKPKHNVLAYDRTPNKNIIIYDINIGEETYLPYKEVLEEASRLGLETVPLLYIGKVSSSVDLENLLDTTSILGGQKIEGFVVKNYSRFGKDKKVLMGKYVSENFKEKRKKEWSGSNPTQGDIVQRIIGQYRTVARWDKAIIHLKEEGKLSNSPKDIGLIIKEVPKDLLSECEEEIKDELWNWAKDNILRGINRGLAEYYKEILFKNET